MKYTYEELLEEMKNAYFDECGQNVDSVSELGKRFEAVASELFALSCYGDFIFKQAFVTTATGEYLDLHADMRGCKRKSEQRATGTLTFYLSEVADSPVSIPLGTVCSVLGKPYLQYATTQGATIEAGKLSVTVPAQALESSEAYNVSQGSVTVMVNPPASVSSVSNSAFNGGCSLESDRSLRKRILEHYRASSNGVNTQSIINCIKELDFVLNCRLMPFESGGALKIYISTANGTLTDEQVAQVKDRLSFLTAIGVELSVNVSAQYAIKITAEVNVLAGFDESELTAKITDGINDYFSCRADGGEVSLGALSRQLISIDGVEDIQLYCADAIAGTVYCPDGQYPYLSDLAVNYIEG